MADGPAIVAGLQRSRAAFLAGDRAESMAIVDALRVEYGAENVSAVVGAVGLGFTPLYPDDPGAEYDFRVSRGQVRPNVEDW